MIKICQECGQPFEATNGMQKFCNNVHYRKCVVCGNVFEVTKYHLTAKDAKTTCSKKCSAELRKRTNLAKYGGVAPACSEVIRSKMEQTNLRKYGVKHAAQAEEFKEKTKQTNLEKYGTEYYSQTEEGRQKMSDKWKDEEYMRSVRTKIEQTSLARYGTHSCLGNSKIRDKAKQTYKQKTGYETPFSNPEVREQIKATTAERHGFAYPLQNASILENWKATNLEKYGTENPMQNRGVLEKAQQTCVDRYGNKCFLQSDEGKEKIRQKMIESYGADYFSQSKGWKLSRMLDPSKVDNLIAFRNDPQSFIQDTFTDKPSLRQLSEVLGIHENSVGQLAIEFNIQDSIRYVYSYMEDEVVELLLSIDPDIEIQRNTHKVITPKELDIYLPQYQIGIECNPTSTHNSTVDSFTGGPSTIPYNYHQAKSDHCDAKGVFLFHIFGPEWRYSRDVIESMLRNLLSKNDTKLYARNLVVKEVSSTDSRKFLQANHRQGPGASSVRLGLYDGDILVSLMTFGKMRNTIGTGKDDLSDCWELVRFCNLLNTSVVGGASKLFKYFIRKYSPTRIRSFSDRAHTRGTLYSILGFEEVRKSEPNYVWVDLKTDKAYHRVNAQKQNIKKFLGDDSIDLSKSEREIMTEHGFVRVYDSGTITWEWRKNR